MIPILQLKQAIDTGGNLVMLGRSMLTNNLKLHTWVIASTPFLPESCSFNERAYCLINHITAVPICPVKNQPRRFENYFKGYKYIKPKPINTQVKTGMQELARIELLKYATMVGSDSVQHGSKVKAYLKQNRERNDALYQLPESLEGSQYVTCPVLNTRTLNIKKRYIEGILLMTVDQFKSKYPNAKLSCNGLRDRIASGLTTVDAETGLTKHELSVKKANKTREAMGSDGLTGYERKGKKTRDTHMANIDEFGRNGYDRLASYRNDTICDNGLSIQQNALAKGIQTQISNGTVNRGRASQLSRKHLGPIVSWLDSVGLKYYFDDKEYALYDSNNSRYYFYDLIIPELNICFEYQSNAYHSNVHWDTAKWNSWKPALGAPISADSKYQYDINKAKLLHKMRGYRTWFVWEGYENIQLALTYLQDLRKDEN